MGFVNDRHGSVERLYPNLAALAKTEILRGAIANTGAVVSAGLADELEIGIIPVLFGDGLRLFENLGDPQPLLETIKVLQSPGRTDIKLRVVN